jgi:hypothetical protein
MFAGIGKNGQLVSISRSLGIVFVRMGNAPDSYGEVPTLFCNQIWQKLNDVMCNTTSISKLQQSDDNISIYPNPFTNKIFRQNTSGNEIYILINSMGQTIWTGKNIENQDFSYLTNGLYIIKVKLKNSTQTFKLIRINP